MVCIIYFNSDFKGKCMILSNMALKWSLEAIPMLICYPQITFSWQIDKFQIFRSCFFTGLFLSVITLLHSDFFTYSIQLLNYTNLRLVVILRGWYYLYFLGTFWTKNVSMLVVNVTCSITHCLNSNISSYLLFYWCLVWKSWICS